MGNAFAIAVGGENLIDQVTTDGDVVSHPGGSPFNVAVAIARQDGRVRYLSPISNDRWGDMLAGRLIGAGVTLAGGRNDRPTTMARVTIANGIPSYSFDRDGTAERAVDTAFLNRVMGRVDALHTGSLALIDGPDAEAWEATLAAVYAEGDRLVSIDPNVRMSIIADPDSYRARIRRMMAHVHLLKLSDEDLADLFPTLDEDAAIDAVRSMTPARLVVLTRGSKPLSAWLGSERIDIPVPKPVPLADSVGAGDTFMATLLVGLGLAGYIAPVAFGDLTRDAAESLLRRAAQAAALNCERAGCNPPTLAELDAALAR